jgi:hypothetical protein
MVMLVLRDTILLVGVRAVRARDLVRDVNLMKKGIESLIFTPPIRLLNLRSTRDWNAWKYEKTSDLRRSK